MFYERLLVLCHNRGISVTAAIQIMGFSSGNLSYWKKGNLPNGDALRKIANFFDVSVDTLVGKKQEALSVEQEKLLLLFSDIPADKRADFLKNVSDLVTQYQKA